MPAAIQTVTSERQPRLKQRLLVLALACGLAFVAQAAFASIASANFCSENLEGSKYYRGHGEYCTVEGHKFNDLNRNGAWNSPGEPGLEGWRIYADYDQDGKLDQDGNDGVDGGGVTEPFDDTDATGYYKFTVDKRDTHVFVRELYQTDWTCSKPGLGGLFELAVPDPYGCVYNVLFYDYPYVNLCPDLNAPCPFYRKGIDFGNWTNKGRIRLKKETDPASDPQKFTFTGALSGQIGNGQYIPASGYTTVDPGNHTASEIVPAGWALDSISCSDGDSTGNTGTGTATFRVAAGEQITCIFHNTKKGKIRVVKETDPNGDPQEFDFAGDLSGTIGDGESIPSSGFTEVAPNHTYDTTETVPGDWDLTSISCSDEEDAQGASTTEDSTATFNVQPGEEITCTFHNRKKGKIRLIKRTDPPEDPQQFDFSGDLAGTIGDGEQLPTPPPDFKEVDPGTYTSTEDVPGGWALTSISCSDEEDAQGASTTEDSTATFNVQPGEEITCTFLNTKDGEVIIEKQTVPDGAGEQFSFTGDAPIGNFPLSDNQQKSQPVTPGTYLVSEADPSGLGALGFDLTSVVCNDAESNQPSSVLDRTATINVEPGETVKCIFTNTQKSPPGTPPGGGPTPSTSTGGPSGGGQKAVTGTASFSAPTGCAGGKFRVSVRGTGIASVTFSLDGKKLKTVRKRGSSNRFTISIDGRKLPVGGHRLTAKVKFVPASPLKSKTLKRTVQRCGAAQPKFTG